MKLHEKDYRKLSKVYFQALVSILLEIFPNLQVKGINSKGYVLLKRRYSLFYKKRHINKLLFSDIPLGLAIKFYGNFDMIDYYRKNIEDKIDIKGAELYNLELIISFLYKKCFNLSIKENSSISNTKNTLDKKEESIKITHEDPINLLDFLFNGWKRKELIKINRIRFRNWMLITSLATGMRFNLLCVSYNKITEHLKVLLSRDPPFYWRVADKRHTNLLASVTYK